MREFFGEQLGKRLAADGKQADLIAGNNVYAHVPDINDFTRGLKGGAQARRHHHAGISASHAAASSAPSSTPSITNIFLICRCTHGERIFKAAGLRVFDVEELPTHGGSLRVYGCHAEDARADFSRRRRAAGGRGDGGVCTTLAIYQAFPGQSRQGQGDLLVFLLEQKRAGKKVAGYGAAAKGNTLLNYAGVKPDLLPFVCDARRRQARRVHAGQPHPDLAPVVLAEQRPDYLLILPWNIAAEVRQQTARLAECGTRFVTAVPLLAVS